jgi:hypothetical protein
LATAWWLALHTADPTDAGTSEVTGGSYARKSIAFDAAASGATQNTGAVSFTGMPATTVTHFSVWSLVTGGVMIARGTVTPNKTTGAGDTLTFAIGDVDITET